MGHRKYTEKQIVDARKSWLRGKASVPETRNDGKPFFVDQQTGANLNARKSSRLGFGSYKSNSGSEGINEKPVATCSFNFRYHTKPKTGALKYDPVSCSEVHDARACKTLRRLRGNRFLAFEFLPMLMPQSHDIQHKIMVVPSVGCPELLCNPRVVENLLWARAARARPTLLCVHASEARSYLSLIGDLLEHFGVGLTAWRCHQPILGFAVSRLAAQSCASDLGQRSEVVLCDVNVIASKSVETGYDSDNEKKYPVRSWRRYTGAGCGSGTPMYNWDQGQLVPTHAKKGGTTRPIEQVVTVTEEMFYDPCFITSTEDADLTQTFLKKENSLRKYGRCSAQSFKGRANIEKMNLGKSLCRTYMQLRNRHLAILAHEDKVAIIYREGGDGMLTTVGDLASRIAKKHGLNPVVIRSLIIEKILLQYKSQYF